MSVFGKKPSNEVEKPEVQSPPVQMSDFSVRADRAAEHAKYVRAYALPGYRMHGDRLRNAQADIAALPVRGSLLDVGCGRGELLDYARERGFGPVMGTETVPALINPARGVRFAEGHDLPFADQSVDVVICNDVIEHVLPRFRKIHSLDYGISPGQKTERGLATTQAILGYVGRRLRPCAGFQIRYGWQDLHVQAYPDIGRRWMSNCEIPDLDLLPAKYGVEKIRFSAGMELSVVHLGLWLLSWAVRLKFPFDLPTYAPALLETSLWFDRFGSADGGMHMIVEGENHAGQRAVVNWFIIARSGDGPYIPAVPAVVLVKKFVAGRRPAPGAVPCVGLITLQDYLDELHGFDVNTYEFTDH